MGHKLWPRPPNHSKFSFSPQILGPYQVPPPPPPLKKPPPPKAANVQAGELESLAQSYRDEADKIEAQTPAPSMKMQLGLMLLSKENAIPAMVKLWDSKGKGEVIRGEFRLHLRNTGLEATSGEADELFDSWDEDKGGSLDIGELKAALKKLASKAKAWRDAPDSRQEKIKSLRKQARLAEDAANALAQAEKLETELEDLYQEYESRADVRLGELLYKRRIRPGGVVQWSTSRGEHSGELSKREFRDAVIKLGLKSMSPADIDAVFDEFDEDKGGFMDKDEAGAMIKGLQKTAEDAEHDKFRKSQAALRMRATATKKAELAMAPLPDEATRELTNGHELTEVKKTSPKPKRKKMEKKPEEAAPAPASAPAPSPEPGPDSDSKTRLNLTGSVSSAVKVAYDALFSSERNAARKDEKARNKRVEANLKSAAGKLNHFQISRAWNTWSSHAAARRYNLNQARSAALKLMQPMVMRAWSTWTDFWDTRRHM